MYAIIETGGKQYRVEKNDVIDVELLEASDSTIDFKNVLFFNNGSTVHIGTPYLNGCLVRGTLLEETKGPKVIAYKYKKRKGVRKKTGHRQRYSRVKITEIQG